MSHDRIPEASRWRTCVHEAGHVALVLLTGTVLVRAAAYRHYSSVSRAGRWGYTLAMHAASPVRETLIEAAGVVAERMFTGAPTDAVLRGCTDRLPKDVETLTLCAEFLAANPKGVLRVASLLREARAPVPAAALGVAFGEGGP